MRQFNIMVENGDNTPQAEQPEGLELILTTQSQIYLEMVKEALEGEGIPALIKSVAGYHARGMLPFAQGFFDFRLFVSKEDEKRAHEIVETIIPPEELR
jgi:hypothetical protein